MYNWVTTRKIARTDGPNYPARAAQTVDAVVSKWIPVTAGLLACCVTPTRAKLDSRYYDAPTYPVRAIQTTDATVRTWIPVFDAELASFTTTARPVLDVRRYDWLVNESAWIKSIPAPPTVAQTSPAWTNQDDQYRTLASKSLEVRGYDWAVGEESWIRTTLTPPAATVWPAFQQTALSDRTRDRARLDVRSYDWVSGEEAWIQATQTQAPTVAQTAPAWTNQDRSYRSPTDPTPLDLFRAQSIPDIFGVPDDWITWVPLQDTGGRIRDRAKLDVRTYDWYAPEESWIKATQTPPPTVAQTAPAWTNQDDSFRTASKPLLDLYRTHSQNDFFGVPDVWAKWTPQFDDGGLTRDRPRLDVRRYDWGQPPWIFAVIQAPAATQAQLWPGILNSGGLSYRTPARATLDVRRYEWAPEFTWAVKVVEATVAKWIPVFDAQWSPMTRAAQKLDVRSLTDRPELAWLFPVVTFPTLVPSQHVLVAPTHRRTLIANTHHRDLLS